MPVFGTPSSDFVVGANFGPVVPTVTPQTTQVFGVPVKARRQALQFSQGITANVNWTVVDDQGNPIDLTAYGTYPAVPGTGGDNSSIQVQVVDSFMGQPPTTVTVFSNPATPVTAAQGTISFPLPGGVTTNPGIYLGQVNVYNTNNTLVIVNQFYVVVNRGLNGLTLPPNGPPSIAEIRLHLRDSDPGDNPLLDTVQFDLAEIVAAIEKPVYYWNESPPPINQQYTTANYPYRFYWLEGIAAQLYWMAAHWYRRNDMQMSSGGLQVDDLAKAQEYQAIGDQKWEAYTSWVQKVKVRINCEAAIQSQFSPYVYFPFGW